MAEPGQIVIAQRTRRLVGGLFDYDDVGPVASNGAAAPSEISQVLGESDAESRSLANRFMALAAKGKVVLPLVVGHRIMGTSLLYLGDIAESRTHFDQAMALHDPPEHHLLATRFGQDAGVAILSNRLPALWLLGYPNAALRDCDAALSAARDLARPAPRSMR